MYDIVTVTAQKNAVKALDYYCIWMRQEGLLILVHEVTHWTQI